MRASFRYLFALALTLTCVSITAADEVTYLHTDVLGSLIAATDENGTLLWEERYEPYGERYYEPATASGNKRSFTGHAEDASGLVYMGARYYNPEIGRFYQIDPVFKADAPTNSGSRYSYANDNPLRFADPDGRWPTEIHNQILQKAFPGLSPRQLSILQDGSFDVDAAWFGGQLVSKSIEHWMRAESQLPADATADSERWVRFLTGSATGAQGTRPNTTNKINDRSLFTTGRATHPVTDRESPQHTDANGDPQVWKGLLHWFDALQHSSGEASPTPPEFQRSVDAAKKVFGDVYGPELLQQAITAPNW